MSARKIIIEIPDSDEAREILGQFTAHLNDDEIPFFEEQAVNYAAGGGAPLTVARWQRMVEVGNEIQRIVEAAIYPEAKR